MSDQYQLAIPNLDHLSAIRGFFRSILDQESIQAILAPVTLSVKPAVMPTLLATADALDRCDPLSPAFPVNAARVVSRLSRKPIGGKIAVFLRPCEIRAFFELVKLKQGNTEELILIGMDCPGAFRNTDFRRFVCSGDDPSGAFFFHRILENAETFPGGVELAEACRSCEHFLPDGADIAIGWIGLSDQNHWVISGRTPKGKELLQQLKLPETTEPASREPALSRLRDLRIQYRDRMFENTASAVSSLQKLSTYLADCVNCYNCRVACPVCYCRECVFVTDVFDHDPDQVLRWSKRRGMVKLPPDTVFYHLTRLAHMSTACVGCGQCSNACPNDIPVMELFRMVAHGTQGVFDYQAGRRLEDPPPLSVFREKEFPEAVGL